MTTNQLKISATTAEAMVAALAEMVRRHGGEPPLNRDLISKSLREMRPDSIEARFAIAGGADIRLFVRPEPFDYSDERRPALQRGCSFKVRVNPGGTGEIDAIDIAATALAMTRAAATATEIEAVTRGVGYLYAAEGELHTTEGGG